MLFALLGRCLFFFEREVLVLAESVEKLAESKLTILYLLNKMGMPMSKGQICQFALEANYIEYFSLQEYILEMVESHFLKETEDSGRLLYLNTVEGEKMLSLFNHRIPQNIRENVDAYVEKMKSKVKKELETKANYSHIGENNYIVRCGIYENENPLLEVNISVVSKEQAVLVCRNWRNKTDSIYLNFVTGLLQKES